MYIYNKINDKSSYKEGNSKCVMGTKFIEILLQTVVLVF